jgi:conjugative relaxase-like TrwC/TraI family protein
LARACFGESDGAANLITRAGPRSLGRSKVAAFDLTFSAPKSVSVLFAIGEPALAGALVAAHESAVDAALGYLEREACRVRRGGVRREVGDGFVAAAYRHRMSRHARERGRLATVDAQCCMHTPENARTHD